MKTLITIATVLAGAYLPAADTTSALITRAVEEATGWTVGELTNGLTLINAVWKREMKTAEGRKRWCGPVVKTEFDTNALEKVTVYENGHRHVEKFASVSAMGIKERLTDAERRARAEAARKAKAEHKERKRLERIAYITTNFSAAVSSVMRQRHYPQELAELLVKHELNTLIGTNTVTVTVTPE